MSKLSVSSYNTYTECPKKFENQFIKGIRPITQPSALIFGSAVDKGLNSLLLGEDNPFEACQKELRRCLTEQTEFLPSDYDGELLDEKTKMDLLKKCRELGYKGENIDSLVSTLLSKPFKELSENQRKALALCCFESLKEKAKLMLEAYETKVLPLIDRVEGVQQKIEWEDSEGNKFVGVLDLPADVKGFGPLIADNKTASNPHRDYGPECVKHSFQLAVYAGATGKTRGGYFVLDKNIKKNRVKTCARCGHTSTGRHKTCDAELPPESLHNPEPYYVRCNGEWIETIRPEVSVIIRIDDIPMEEIQIAQSAMSDVARAVKSGNFPKNLKQCRVMYGTKEVRCPYYEYCRNGSMEGLKKTKT